tara:strand:- start:9532 stop:9852 length:321 start_codon:yes stop_codon:yes gene_type:complete
MANSGDVLKAINEGNIAQAEINVTMLGKISAISNNLSDMKTDQGLINIKVLGYLENNDKTDEKGIINRVHDVEESVETMKNQRKIFLGVITVFGIIGGALLKMFKS